MILAWVALGTLLPILLTSGTAAAYLPWWQDVEVGTIQRARGLAWTIHPRDAPSRSSAIQVFENGRPLSAAGVPGQVETTPGLFHRSAGGRLWFSSRSGRDLSTENDITIRQAAPVNTRAATLGFLGLGLVVGLLTLAVLSISRGTRPLVPLSLALMGFLIIHIVLRWASPPAGADRLGQLLDRVREDRDRVEVVAIGSSHVFRHFDPAVFDAALPTTTGQSFNLGAEGMRMAEAVEVATQVLAIRPPNLRWIIIDSGDGSVDSRNSATRRAIRSHGAGTATVVLPELVSRVLVREIPAERLHAGVRSTALHVSRTGEAPEWIRSWLGYVEPNPGVRGYESLDEALRSAEGKRVRQSLRNRRRGATQPSYLQRKNRLASRTERPTRLIDPLEIQLIRQLQQAAARQGVGVIYVISPQLGEHPNLLWAADQGEIDHLLLFNDPVRYPELYSPENRWDSSHLNERGARLFTRHLADELRAIGNETNTP